MPLIAVLLVSLVLSDLEVRIVPDAVANGATSQQTCADAQTCRQLALEAAGRKDYDAFHDLAWRAVNAGPKNDPALMLLLARAQSMSGRPHDALVMLQRLAAMNAATDATTSEDFANVRALPGWADVEARLAGKAVPPADEVAKASAAAKPAAAAKPDAPPVPPPTVAKPVEDKPVIDKPAADKPAVEKLTAEKPVLDKSEKPASAKAPVEKPAAKTEKVPAPKAARNAKPEAAVAEKPAEPEPLTFEAAGLDAVGLGYDAVSSRFIVGDGRDRRLLVVGERSGRLASLAGVDAGFHDVKAFEIDAREGDLWVVSASDQGRTTVHKLQLISGRVIASVALPDDMTPGRFTDVGVTPQSILVLDAGGRRVLRLAKKGKTLEVAARLAVPEATSLAPASDVVAYAAFDRGILRLDLTSRSMTVVEPADRVDLTQLLWMRWFRGSLLATQRTPEGAYRLLRIRLDENGRIAKSADVLDDNVLLAGPSAATLSGNTLYYLSRASGDGDVVIRKVTLK